MKNHPLFNDSTDDSSTAIERQKKEICYINIQQIMPGNKRITLTNQWEAEQLVTPLDVFQAIGEMEGDYELIGRGNHNQIVDRARINVRAPIGWRPGVGHPLYGKQQEQPPPAQAPAPVGAPAGPMMTAPGGLLIPANMDPNVAMMISMMALNSQRDAENARQQQQAFQFQSQQMMQISQQNLQMMQASQQNTTNLIGSLVSNLAPLLAARSGGGGSESGAETGFVKGVEVMAALKEGVDSAVNKGQTDWAQVAQHVSTGIRGLAEIAKQTAPAAAPAAPVVPPGGPPA